MLAVKHIPLYEEDPESWDRFLYKAMMGSAKATDTLSNAHMAYMVDLTGVPKASETIELVDYQLAIHEHFGAIEKPESARQLGARIDTQDWFAIKLNGQWTTPLDHQSYAGLWARKTTVSQRSLLSDAVRRCHSSWSADWLVQVIDDEATLQYNSVNVVAAMLLLGLTWKA